jgi:hypothetical protein
MKPSLIAAAAFAVLAAGPVLAGERCTVPAADWQPQAAVLALAEANGWTLHEIEIDDGCYEVEGRDRSGREFEATLDPATLRVIEMELDDDRSRPAARTPAPAGAAEPPKNGLFGTGSPPKVQVN